MSLVGFKAQNHRQQVGRRGINPKVDDRATAPEVFGPLDKRFGFSIDVAALPHNAKCVRYLTPEQDGLKQSWAGEDTDVTFDDLTDASISSIDAKAVALLTRIPGQHYSAYIARLVAEPDRAGEIARTVKEADLLDNVRRCLETSDGAADRYRKALAQLLRASSNEHKEQAS